MHEASVVFQSHWFQASGVMLASGSVLVYWLLLESSWIWVLPWVTPPNSRCQHGMLIGILLSKWRRFRPKFPGNSCSIPQKSKESSRLQTLSLGWNLLPQTVTLTFCRQVRSHLGRALPKVPSSLRKGCENFSSRKLTLKEHKRA